MRGHMQPVRDQRNRAEQKPAGDLGDHHEGAKYDYRPGAALVALVALAEKDVAVKISGAVRHDPVLRGVLRRLSASHLR